LAVLGVNEHAESWQPLALALQDGNDAGAFGARDVKLGDDETYQLPPDMAKGGVAVSFVDAWISAGYENRQRGLCGMLVLIDDEDRR
jgi:hypothetical protein